MQKVNIEDEKYTPNTRNDDEDHLSEVKTQQETRVNFIYLDGRGIKRSVRLSRQ